MTTLTFDTRADWLAARRLGIGGSDVPAILGLSRWRTPLQVWANKVGIETEAPGTPYNLDRGHHMEPFLSEQLEADIPGLHVRHYTDAIVVGSEPWMRYSPDGVADKTVGDVDEYALVEFKSHPRGASEWDEGAPPHVVAQVQWGMVVCDLPACYVAVDLGTEFKWQRIPRDPDWLPMVLPKLRAFWALVESETPPPAEAEDSDVLKRLYPEPTRKMVVLPPDFVESSERILALGGEIKRLTKELDGLKNKVKAAIGDAEVGVLPTGSGEWRWKVEHKDAYMVKPQDNRVLRWSAKKER